MPTYLTNRIVNVQEFKDLLVRSTLAGRRPVEDEACLKGMLENSNLTVSCWEGDLLIGIGRCVTDFHYCCYLSDLAVDVAYQNLGIGKRILRSISETLGNRCKIILLSAPAAVGYYSKLGFTRHDQAWVLAKGSDK